MKTGLRENRLSGGSRARAANIVSDLRTRLSPRDQTILETASGAKIFAIWKAIKSRRHS